MTPAARLQAAIEIMDMILMAVADNGPAADTLIGQYFRTRRYAGSKDRAAVREFVYRVLRSNEVIYIRNPRVLFAIFDDLHQLFGSTDPHAPAALTPAEVALLASPPGPSHWLCAHITPPLWSALMGRAPLDLRVNIRRTRRAEMLEVLRQQELAAEATPYAPWGIRMPNGTAIESLAAYREGLIEVQDEASQLVALACLGGEPALVIDLCAGAGGKTLALAAALPPKARLIASDIDPKRLERLKPRALRAGIVIETCPPAALTHHHGQADLVLIDAPCSSTGTWRRNPEARLRFTPERLASYVATQAELIDYAVALLRPGGRLVYAVCSVLDQEGATQISAALARHPALQAQPPLPQIFPAATAGLSLRPDQHGTDGFFIACLDKLC